MGKIYQSYLHLSSMERKGVDYRIRSWTGTSGIAVMAPHGGDIEPGTTEIAEATAHPEHSFYSFEGMKPDDNLGLHIASTLFDEPGGLMMAAKAMTIITVHGCKERDPVVFAGGLDIDLRRYVTRALDVAGFMIREDPRLPGRSPKNLCNRSRMGRGVQLEISRGLRRVMFTGLKGPERRKPFPPFDRFVTALRKALAAHTLKDRFL